MIVVAAKLRTKVETARRVSARAIVEFIGLHNLLSSVVAGRLSTERVERLHFRIDDALLPLSEIQALDGFLDGLDAGLSLDQFEKQARMRIRILDPVAADPDAARKKRCVRIERRDDDTAVLEMIGPIGVIEALFQRLRAMARAIRRQEIGALGLMKDGQDLDAKDLAGRLLDDRRVAELMFDLLAGSRPQTQVRVGPKTGAGDGADLPEGSFIDVLCPTDGDWLRKQAQVTITVPVSTVLSVDERPGRVNGDVPVSAEFCRDAAGHATSWFRVLTDPATSIVTDHVAQTYEPTAAMRRTVRAKWRTCTVPGCSYPAGWCEIEHCCRFSKIDPASGGLTVMENLHAMCKHHHELKTQGVIRLQRLGRNEVAWVLPMGQTASTSPPPLAAGLDPPDPGVLVARAELLDRAPVGEDFEGPDLFTTVQAPEESETSDVPDVPGEVPPPF
ncbi:HNH endonuclease signature motif containing protein [Brevibacterium sp. Mu109]|uniref:HNH endonuclease signature motif containing protein n=1 Tax=Brevibacterium sp. Mu109 TaxID=1255669 RepID=UPI0035B56573